jgi:acyl-[acyl-carrier-protein]-phospholipid O-acyltransferase / long-chain-fatty-acid--[acyl-carrier-protein] ligase
LPNQESAVASVSFELLRTRRFAPLFWTQALGGFNDNLFKQAMALMVAYHVGGASGLDPASLTAIAGATFVAPFIFLSGFAGSLADAIDKASPDYS